MTAPAPDPNGDGQYTPGTIPNPFSLNQVEGAGVPTPQQIGGAIGKAITGGLGLKVNLINIVLNTLLYGMIAAGGVYLTYKGLRLLVNEVTGAPGAASYIGGIAKAPARLFGKIGAMAV
jgi:hypothetical protein